jgi:plastocyanin
MARRSRTAGPAGAAAVALACASVALLAGCGSSGSSTGGSSSTPGTAAAEQTGTTSSTGSSLKKAGRPKYGAPSAGAPVRSGAIAVAYKNVAIYPGKLRVKTGTTVTWTNYDPVEHNVTSEGGPQRFASKNFGEGASYSITLTRPGVVHYLCTLHPASMNGTIEVVK